MVYPVKPLGEICENLDSRRVPITKKDRVEGEVPYYGASGIVDYVDDFIFDEDLLLVSEDGANLLARTYPIAFSVIGKSWVNNHAHTLSFGAPVTQKFVEYFLNSIPLNDFVSGMAQPKLNQRALNSIPVPCPTSEEQKRIVAILDKVFADIEQVRTKTEQNLKNARELFESYLQQVFSQRGEGWKASKLKMITSKIGSGATPRGGKAAYKDEGLSLIRSMNVHDRFFKNKDLALIDDDQASKLSNVEVEVGDVLLNITGASVARCCVAPSEYLPARVNQHVSIIRVDQSIVRSEFLNFALTSKYYKDQLLGIGEAGSTRQAITKTQIEEFEVNYPKDLKAQKTMLNQLLGLESETLAVQDIYIKKLESLEELKKSILQKAFSGELTKDTEEVAA